MNPLVSSARRIPPPFWLALITLVTLAPFLHKAFHIDDPLFIWMAEQIDRHPLKPYDFLVNWSSYPRPMWDEMQNPPLASYFIAAFLPWFGQSEIALHTGFLLWAVASVLGVYYLARRFDAPPAAAALLTLFTPVFLVSATNVMCDVMMLAFFIWAIEFWLRAVENARLWPALFSALLISAALLTKYFGICLVPLLAAYDLAQSRRIRARLLFLALPLLVVLAYEIITKAAYGRGLFFVAGNVAYGVWDKMHFPLATQMTVGLCFAGGCLFSFVFFARARLLLAAALAGVVGIVAFLLLVPTKSAWALGNIQSVVQIEGGIFVGVGLTVLALAAFDCFRRRAEPTSVLLLLWVGGTVVFSVFLNWSITARTLLPAAPAGAILFLRQVPALRTWRIAAGLIPAAALSLACAASDTVEANAFRTAAENFQRRFQSELGTVWFQSHWGFQYYMERWGAKPVNIREFRFDPGDIIVIPANNTAIRQIDTAEVFTPEEVNFPLFPLLTTFAHPSAACFYSSTRGPLPWVINRVPPEKFYVARFR